MWLEKDTNPTWAKLADGFDYAGQRALARKIRETYNCELIVDFFLINWDAYAVSQHIV